MPEKRIVGTVRREGDDAEIAELAFDGSGIVVTTADGYEFVGADWERD